MDIKRQPDEASAGEDDASEETSTTGVVLKKTPVVGVPVSSSVVPTPVAGGIIQGSRKWVFVQRHRAWTALRTPRWWFLTAITLAQLGAVAWPVIKLKVGWWDIGQCLFSLIVLNVVKQWKQNQPQDRHIVSRNYDERKLALYKLIHSLSEKETLATTKQIEGYQRDALALIASYVRDHCRDLSTPTIFANLLIDGGNEIVVIARNEDHRLLPAHYPKACMVAAKVFETGEPALTGDVYRDYPETVPGKPYKSILSIPVHHDGAVVGVVSIDSSRAFHFDLEGMKLVDYLRPYIALLAWTLKS